MTITIENAIMQELIGDEQKNAIDFVSFLRDNQMEFIRGDGYWINHLYWYVKYKNHDVCYILVNGKNEEKEMAIWSNTDDSQNYEGLFIDEYTKNIAWENVDFCGKCTPNSTCYGGIQKTIFGKVCNHVCRCTFKFVNPDYKEYRCIKELVMLRKKEIQNETYKENQND